MDIKTSKYIGVFTTIFFLIGIIVFIFKSQLSFFIWKANNSNPVEWNNLIISFQGNIAYKLHEEGLIFFMWDNDDGYLHVREKNLSLFKKNEIEDFLRKKNYEILTSKSINFKEMPSFEISYLDNTSHTYNHRLYIIPQNIYFYYEGQQESYANFKKIISNTEFF
ncbi:MAG: hypothetical protein ABIJ12_09970 [bacterium]